MTDRRTALAALTAITIAAALVAWQPALAEDADTADPQEMMAEWVKNTTPGEHHKALDVHVGKWDVKVTMWMDPEAEPQVSQGESQVDWFLGKRFLRENFSCEMEMGGETHQYQGMGLTGYDNIEQEYVSIWIDNMNTAITTFDDGEYDEATKTLTMEGEGDDPMTGIENEMTAISRVVSDDEIHFELHMEPEGGEKHKCMEMVYTRRK